VESLSPYETTFRYVTPDDEKWLDCWYNEGAKELVVEACLLCIDLVSPSATGVSKVRLSEADRNDFRWRWRSVCYGGTTFQQAMSMNLATAFEINRLTKVVGEDERLTTASRLFLEAAQNQLDKLIAGGMPDSFRPWRRLLAESGNESE
jgi:hypothetical protein